MDNVTNQLAKTPYAQTIDAAFKMLRLCGVTYTVADGVIFVTGRDGLIYNTLAATTEYTYTPTPDAFAPAPAPTLKKPRQPDLIARKEISMDARLKFRRVKHSRQQVGVFEPYLINLKVGDVAQIPIAVIPQGVTPERFRASMSAWAATTWGKRTHRTCITDTHVELLRTA